MAQIKRWVTRLVIGALLILAFVSLGQKLLWAQRIWNSAALSQDQATLWEQRLARLKRDLAGKGAVIGYVSEIDVGMPNSLIDTNTEFTLTQYVLAPIIIQRGVTAQWVIGNFGGVGFKPEFGSQLGVSLAEDYGYGIVLLRRNAP